MSIAINTTLTVSLGVARGSFVCCRYDRVDPTPSVCHYMDMQFESRVWNPECKKELRETAGQGYSLNTENTLVKIK